MVTIEKDRFIIVVDAPSEPQVHLYDTIQELIDLLQCIPFDLREKDGYYNVHQLLKSMIPSK